MMTVDVKQINEQVEKESSVINQIRTEVHKVIVGQEELIDGLILALLCNNHVLIEGVPGLAKTLSVTTLAGMLQGAYERWLHRMEAIVIAGIEAGQFRREIDPSAAATLCSGLLDGLLVHMILRVGPGVDEGRLTIIKRAVLTALGTEPPGQPDGAARS